MRNLVLFGADDMAEVSCYLFEHDSDYQVAAFTVDHAYREKDTFCGRPLCDFETVQDIYPPQEYDMFVAVGYSKVNKVREQKYHEAKAKGYRLATYVSSRAICYPPLEDIGDNTFIFESNTIQPFAKIGNDVIIWNGNFIGHHSQIGDHVFITSHVAISGRTVVGNSCFIGSNATIHDHVHIAERCVIGSATLITRDTEPGSVYKGAFTRPQQESAENLKFFKGNHNDNN